MAAETSKRSNGTPESVDTIVVGGGQAGLCIGRTLVERGVDVVILDASERVGDAWRNRWDSLHLFSPARMNGLPGMSFPAPGASYVSKDQMADFLEDYARSMNLPIRSGVRVTRLTKQGDQFIVSTSAGTFGAQNVVVAMADYQTPKVPAFAGELAPDIKQIHSFEYKNPAQLSDGPALVVGLGNSGAEIAYELAQTRQVYASGQESGAIPFKLGSWFGRHIGTTLVRFAMVRVLNDSTPMGRRARPKMERKAAPLVRVRPKELKGAGVARVGRIAGTQDGKPVTEDGKALDVSNVVWCTGYKPGFDWIDLPVFDKSGRPMQRRGVVEEVPGLYFLGLHYLHAIWSDTVTGMVPDSAHIANHLSRSRNERVAILA